MHFVLKKPLASYRQFNSLEVRISAQVLSFILSNKTGLSSQSQEEMLATLLMFRAVSASSLFAWQ